MDDQAARAEFRRLARNLARADKAGRSPQRTPARSDKPSVAGQRGGSTPPAAKPRAAESRRERGLRLGAEIYGAAGARVLNRLMATSPEVARDIVDFAYGDVIAEGQLDGRTRALVVVAALAAVGHAQPQLQVHIGSALRSGCTRAEVTEALRLVALYAGFPAALNGLAAAREAFAAVRPARRRQPKRKA